MRYENINFTEFYETHVKTKNMSVSWESGFFRLYTYIDCGFLHGVLIRANGLSSEGWDDKYLTVDTVYYAECHCGEIKNLWIGDSDGNLYYPEIKELYLSLEEMERLAKKHIKSK